MVYALLESEEEGMDIKIQAVLCHLTRPTTYLITVVNRERISQLVHIDYRKLPLCESSVDIKHSMLIEAYIALPLLIG